MRLKNVFATLLSGILIIGSLTACGAKTQDISSSINESSSNDVTSSSQSASAENLSSAVNTNLAGESLLVYCGAGMTEPFQKIVDEFEAKTGCDITVNFANAAQLQTQINTAKEGDLFVAGSVEELKPVEANIIESKELVKHIPVLAVQAGNPLGITGLNDLTKQGVTVVLGDAEATPIGKIANKALTDLGILENVDVISRAMTAPAIATALEAGECDAAIVWKENCSSEKIEIVNSTDLDTYIKTIPVATLSFSNSETARLAFLDSLNTDAAKAIWQEYGYETLN